MNKKRLRIYLDSEEDKLLEAKAKNLGYKFKSTYVKDTALNKYIYSNLFKSVAFEVNRIGVNVMQLTKVANTNKEINKDVLSALLKIDLELGKILDLIKESTK